MDRSDPAASSSREGGEPMGESAPAASSSREGGEPMGGSAPAASSSREGGEPIGGSAPAASSSGVVGKPMGGSAPSASASRAGGGLVGKVALVSSCEPGDGPGPDVPRAASPVLSPFPVDPEVMARIRPMRADDAFAVARLHHAAMGRSLWARLGLPFLRGLYRGLVRDPRFLAFVYEEDGRVRGFIAGTTDSARLFGETLKREFRSLVGPVMLGVLRHPSVMLPLLQTAAYFRRSSPDPFVESVSAESFFCSFEPELRGCRVSGHINKVLFDELYARGHEHVKVTTETDNPGSNRQLTSWGFEQRGCFRHYGKQMVVYVLHLPSCPRVEPVSRHPAPMPVGARSA